VPGESQVVQPEVWRYVGAQRQPSVMVVQDMDQPPARGCAWGDVAASILLRLGCVGALTNGGVRDIREVEALVFQLFAASPVVGHAYIRYVEINTPVKISSLVIHPGDLLHSDEHGIVIIPKEVILEELVARCREFLASEKVLIDYCAQPGFGLDEVAPRWRHMSSARAACGRKPGRTRHLSVYRYPICACGGRQSQKLPAQI